ncbi:MAG: peptidoglycan editing factor PgeF, partial [Thiohalobacterales bacterium]|nr:peptidoglycan editing factor PgeF [Thiohalobacterales bacterium]
MRDWIEPDWPAPPGVRAVTTTRNHGVSTGPFRSMNPADHVGDDPAAVRENRARLASQLGLPSEPAWLRQVHGTRVVDAAGAAMSTEADASWTDRGGVVCAVLTADCLPVLLCDREARCVAAIHAGWRGLAAGVIEATVAALPTGDTELLAWLGPAIGAGAFTVGEEVREAFVAHDPGAREAFSPGPADRLQADLYRLA